MGMDVYSRTGGKYFRNNVWWWHPLWDYCYAVSNGLITHSVWEQCHMNSGRGLMRDKAERLADILFDEIATGRCAKYAAEYAAAQEALPEQTCDICGGTGHRLPPPAVGPGPDPCNGCNGKGTRRPWITNYPFSVENVQEFAEFLRGSGGFRVW